MLGRTHVTTTVSTGLLGLYGLYHAEQTFSLDTWYGSLTHQFVEMIGLDFTLKEFSLFFALFICIIGLAIGALLPDIDSKRSILGRYVPFVEDLVGHRTITHTIWVISGLFLISYFFGQTILWMISFGYLFHVIQDSFSVQGIDWLWPIGKGYKNYGGASIKRGFHIGIYRVGGILETVIHIFMFLLFVYMLYQWWMIAYI